VCIYRDKCSCMSICVYTVFKKTRAAMESPGAVAFGCVACGASMKHEQNSTRSSNDLSLESHAHTHAVTTKRRPWPLVAPCPYACSTPRRAYGTVFWNI
jgi:hypothetical protein